MQYRLRVTIEVFAGDVEVLEVRLLDGCSQMSVIGPGDDVCDQSIDTGRAKNRARLAILADMARDEQSEQKGEPA
jgi:hypothetical protein